MSTPTQFPHERRAEFVHLFAQEGRSIYRFVRCLVISREDAEEIFQESSLIAWESFGSFEEGTHFGKWFRQIAFNRVRNYRRKNKSSDRLLSDELIEAISATRKTGQPQFDARLELLENCLGELAMKERRLINQHYEDNLSIRAIASDLGRSVDTVYKSLAKIRWTLFDCVTQKLARSKPA